MMHESTTAVAEPPVLDDKDDDLELNLEELDEILSIDVVDTINPNPNNP